MKLQKFIDVLDNKDDKIAVRFFKRNGKDIFASTDLLMALISQKWSKKKWYRLYLLSWVLMYDMRCSNFSTKKIYNDILPVYRYFADYMCDACVLFKGKGIPFKEWKDLAKEETEMLNIFIQKNQLKEFRKTTICKKICK